MTDVKLHGKHIGGKKKIQ